MDYILIAIMIAGIGLSGAYLRAELVLNRKMTAAQRRRELMQHESQTKRVHLGQNDISRQPRAIPASLPASVFQILRVLACALRIFIQERTIHRIWIRT
jgi:hypothetical protein